MPNSPDDEHPIWCDRASLARRSAALGAINVDEVVCRIALSSAEMRALLGTGAPPEGTTRIAAWDPPVMLLADDPSLATLLRAAGVDVPHVTSTFAQREGEARDRLAAATHRFEDHGEVAHGNALDARVAVVIAWGHDRARQILDRLGREVAQSGLVLDARAPRELRAFVVASLPAGRAIIVGANGVDEASASDLAAALETVLRAAAD